MWGPEEIPYTLPQPCSNVAPHCPTALLKHSLNPQDGNLHAGEGKYRLELNIAGASCVGVEHSVRVPEAFTRRSPLTHYVSALLPHIVLFME